MGGTGRGPEVMRICCMMLAIFSSAVIVMPCAEAVSEAMAFRQMERSFLEAQYARAITEADKLIDMRASNRDEIYYIKGLSLLKTNRYKDARVAFEKITLRSQWSKRSFDAFLGIGDSYLLEGNSSMAVHVYEEMLVKYKADKNLPLVYHRLSAASKSLGLTAKAKEYGDKLKGSAPLSFEANGGGTIPVGPPAASSLPAPSPSQPQPKTERAPAPSDTASFSVQVGSFKNQSNAGKLASALAQKGYDAYTESYYDAAGTFYRVKVGKFTTKDEAKRTASQLQNLGYNTKICTNDLCQ